MTDDRITGRRGDRLRTWLGGVRARVGELDTNRQCVLAGASIAIFVGVFDVTIRW